MLIGSDLTVRSLSFHVVDGIIKVGMFVGYIALISLMSEIRRVFQYHGAEHKSIHAYEKGEELTVENARKYPTLHARCGTAFLLLVLVSSIFLFAVVFPLLPKDIFRQQGSHEYFLYFIQNRAFVPNSGFFI